MVSIKDEINKLVDLQHLDSQILALRQLLEDKPQQIAKLEAAFEEKKAGLKNQEEKLKALQVKNKERETALGSKEENIKKLQNQLYSLKTNKEYQSMLSEIAGQKADCSMIEEEILRIFDEIDSVKTEINKEKQFLVEQEKELAEEKNAVNKEIADAQAQLKTLEEKRAQMAQGVDADLLAHYERILESRSGLAVAEVKDDSCQGCFMNMPPQVINEIKLAKHIVTCETCNRILYINPANE